jgi:hypothetical protein
LTGQAKKTKKGATLYVADFETTTTPDDCRVWAWGMVDIEKTRSAWHVEIGQDIGSFMGRIQKETSIIYFHNLRFDGSFILDYLHRKKYSFIEDGRPRKGEFTHIVSSMNQWYSITIKWDNGNQTEFRDSAKKIRMPVKQIARTFDLFEKKGKIDYHAYRKPGHIITKEERAYIVNDVIIVAKALKKQLDAGLTKLTSSADALAEYKALAGKSFNDLFPVLSLTMDGEIRDAYRGGFTHAPKRFRGIQLGPGMTFDVNSLYPSVMYTKLLPYGEPVYREGLPRKSKEYPLFIVSITFTAKLKKDHVPCIQIKNSRFHNDVEYQEHIKEPVTLACSNVDLELWADHYDMTILSYNGGWAFQGIHGVFNEYIEKWMDIKAVSEGGIRAMAKSMLNDLYGKFATNPDVTPNVSRLEDDVVKFSLGDEMMRNPVFTAMGVFITSYAREITIRAAQDNYAVFAYADTDSLHLLTTTQPDNLDIHPSRLGAWKHEYDFQSAFFARSKAYAERHYPGGCKKKEHEECFDDNHDDCHTHRDGGCYEVHVSGMPVNVAHKLTFDDFTNGRYFGGNLKQKRVPGGVVLIDSGFTLKF